MATTQPQDQPRKKRTRAKVPKVRTGCKTCRRRHLKCDEAKPSCLRCLRDKWICDGYSQSSSEPFHVNVTSFFKLPLHTKSDKMTSGPSSSLRPSLTGGVLVNTADNALYYHTREWVIPDLEMINGSREFWYHIILPISYSNTAIKHALCALGASHQWFLASYPGNLTNLDHSIDYEHQASVKYSEAFAMIQPVMAENSRTNIHTALLCCTIFICIENLHRRYANSVRHLHAGHQLLQSLRAIQSLKQLPNGTSCQREDQNNGLLNILAAMFSSLEKSIGAFTGDTSFFNMIYCTPEIEMGNPKTPFLTITEAEDSLSALNTFFDNCLFGSDSLRHADQQVGCKSLAQSTTDSFIHAMDLINPLFLCWSSKMQLFVMSVPITLFGNQEKRRLAVLSLYQTTWSAFLNTDPQDTGFTKSDYESILSKIEQIVALEHSQTRPVFAFDGHLVRELSTICASCTDTEIRTRSITILRSMNRREGVWDSWEVANIYEKVFSGLEDGTLSFDNLPWGLTDLIKKLCN
ncbi:uncharacterized protein B0J16DRAFT_343540 [Fusarium flagelliforme]|uniref:uncharacterized protein n=1 Tax=Fusarium flagelliforme TaxID=2675880 RepID=UPI001E8E1F64|nr:uncharacterized protein B0J16DRAFT_343540 [Fusarium flagelliforme]KAH7182334.1 hypothetical protein B0J16DRAFT_343540 [Fusarium flagelliforme]